MYSLKLRCKSHETETLSFQLWEAGTVAVSELNKGDGCALTAGFEDESARVTLIEQFAAYRPEWCEDRTDWEAVTRQAWPGRAVGKRLYVAPPWSEEQTPNGRLRLIQNPGQASGTGEHPCTQLALQAIESEVFAGCGVLDVGTGSGILAIAALKLGAGTAVGIDVDESALQTARENSALNGLAPLLATGTVGCVAEAWAAVTVANISATVLLAIADDLLRVTAMPGILILTGFPGSEAGAIAALLPGSEITYLDGWACLTAKLS